MTTRSLYSPVGSRLRGSCEGSAGQRGDQRLGRLAQDQGEVVGGVAVGVGEDTVVEGVRGVLGEEREGRAVGGAGLGEVVGVEERPVARLEAHPDRARGAWSE
ncbi:hypothetical protein ABZ896_01130 [Streptomyces sp. NPDC047072]|uniref:hypothetical protein n=1 Tax=Streptomyces sp. NPDC047072 TaxID=3154809 RepID=UPI0033DFCF09